MEDLQRALTSAGLEKSQRKKNSHIMSAS